MWVLAIDNDLVKM